ncbi:MAG: PAS domain S-box protein, partial [Sedimentisphaerales bacterium]
MNDSDKTKEQLIEELDLLRHSKTRYETIFETVREGILIMDVETRRFRYANPAICAMFGYTQEEFTRFSVQDIHPREQMDRILADFEANIQNKKNMSHNIPCLRKDKTIFYADINTANVIIDNRRCDIGCFTDVTRHKLDEEALRQSEQRFKSVVENIAVGVVLISPQMEIISINNRIKQRYPDIDVSTRPICYKTFNSPPREAVCSYCPIVKTLADGLIHEAITSTRRSGKVIHSRIISSPIKDADGRITAVIEVVEDITERKNAEEALRESEEKFRNLAERSFDIIFTIDTNGFIKYVSPACERIFGYKPEEMTDKHFRNFVADSYMQPAAEYFSGTLKECNPAPFSFEAKRKDGHHVFIEANMSPVVWDDAIRGVQGVARDITYRRKTQEELQKAHDQLESRVQQRTAELAGAVEKLQREIAERKRAEESLRQAEERFRTIFENAVVGIYRTTPDGRILMANPAIIKLLGYNSFDEISRLNLEKEGIDPSTPRSTFKQRMERDGSVTGLESIWFRRDGSRLYVLENAFAVRDNDGNIIYYEGTAQDITQRKEAEEKLFLYQEQLRSLASQLSLAEERLRRKIATDLHDNVSQNLAISKMKLEALAQSVNSEQAKTLKEV